MKDKVVDRSARCFNVIYILLVLFTAEKCIRASPEEDYTNGFFVALFVRKDSETEQIPTECNGVSHKRKRKNPNKTQLKNCHPS